MTQMGNKVVFEAGGGGYIENGKTKEKLKFRETGGMYMLKMWIRRGGGVPAEGFARQGQW